MFTGQLDINTFALGVIGLLTLLNTLYSRRTEKNTNSMKDELVKVTGEKAHAAGKEEGRQEGESKAATLAQGALAQKQKGE